MAYDSQANQGDGTSSGPDEGSDHLPPGGYGPPPSYPSPPGAAWPPPAPAYGRPGPPSYPPAPPYGGYATPPPGYQPPGPPGYGPSTGYGAYPSGYGYPGAVGSHTDGTAVAALVLAIASFVFCPLVPAVIALAIIPGARRTIGASGGAVDGLGLLTAAKILAWLNIGLALFFGVVIAVIGIASSLSSSNAWAHSVSRLAL